MTNFVVVAGYRSSGKSTFIKDLSQDNQTQAIKELRLALGENEYEKLVSRKFFEIRFEDIVNETWEFYVNPETIYVLHVDLARWVAHFNPSLIHTLNPKSIEGLARQACLRKLDYLQRKGVVAETVFVTLDFGFDTCRERYVKRNLSRILSTDKRTPQRVGHPVNRKYRKRLISLVLLQAMQVPPLRHLLKFVGNLSHQVDIFELLWSQNQGPRTYESLYSGWGGALKENSLHQIRIGKSDA